MRRCAAPDGMIALACGNDAQFRRLAQALGAPRLAEQERFATNPARVANRSELIVSLEQFLVTDTATVWEQRFTQVGVPAGLVGDIGAGIAQAEKFGLAPLITFSKDRPRQIRHPVQYRCEPAGVGIEAQPTELLAAVPPKLGEHNDLVRNWLAAPQSELLHPAAVAASTKEYPKNYV